MYRRAHPNWTTSRTFVIHFSLATQVGLVESPTAKRRHFFRRSGCLSTSAPRCLVDIVKSKGCLPTSASVEFDRIHY